MIRIAPIIFGILFLSACVFPSGLMTKAERKELRQKERCQRKYDRYKDRCEVYTRTDTVIVEIPVLVDSQVVSKSFEANKDTIGVDSIIGKYKAMIEAMGLENDSLALSLFSSAGLEIVRYIKNSRCIEDTIAFDTTIVLMIDGKTVSVKITTGATQPDPQTIVPFVLVPPQELTLGIEVKDEKIVRPELSMKEQLYKQVMAFWWVLVVAVLLFVLLRTFWGTIKRFLGL